jgi:pilus assembly protein Flp/PilA
MVGSSLRKDTMTNVSSWLRSRVAAFRVADEDGQGLAEYALILGLVAVLCVAALQGLQGAIGGSLTNTAAQF